MICSTDLFDLLDETCTLAEHEGFQDHARQLRKIWHQLNAFDFGSALHEWLLGEPSKTTLEAIQLNYDGPLDHAEIAGLLEELVNDGRVMRLGQVYKAIV